MPDARGNPFAALQPPAPQDRGAKVDELRLVSGWLLASDFEAAQRLGENLRAYLEGAGTLEEVLGLKPPRGSTMTAVRVARRRRILELQLELARTEGSVEAAIRVLQGASAPRPESASVLDQLRPLAPSISRRDAARLRKLPPHRG